MWAAAFFDRGRQQSGERERERALAAHFDGRGAQAGHSERQKARAAHLYAFPFLWIWPGQCADRAVTLSGRRDFFAHFLFPLFTSPSTKLRAFILPLFCLYSAFIHIPTRLPFSSHALFLPRSHSIPFLFPSALFLFSHALIRFHFSLFFHDLIHFFISDLASL